MKKLGILFAFITLSVWASAGEFMFKHLEVKDGLSNNQVNDIFKDAEGFVWISTASGLNRYDGYEVKAFRSYNMSTGPLPDNNVQRVQQAADGNLWIETSAGYTIYNPVTGVFNRDVRSWMLEVGIESVPTLTYITQDKRMWFYLANKGCYLYIPESQLLYPLLFDTNQLPAGEITDISECKDGILVVYSNGLVLCFDKETNKMKWQLTDIKQKQGDKSEAYTLFVDREGDIWIYSPLGVWVYTPANKKWKTQLAGLIQHSTTDVILSMSQNTDGRIWVGKSQSGVDVIDKSTGTTLSLLNRSGNERGLQDKTITALYGDHHGVMWVGTKKKGVSFYNEAAYKFNLKAIDNMSCIEEDRNGYIWLGTNGSGLIRWNVTTGEQISFTHGNPASLASDHIVCILTSKNGRIWIGTARDGLDCYDNGRFIHYKQNQATPNSLVSNRITSLVEDEEGTIWISTSGGGVQSFNQQTGQFTTYNTETADLQSNDVASLCVTMDNNLLIGSDRGLSILNLKTKKLNNLIGTKSGKTHLPNQNVTQVYEDSRGLIWIGTREGLNLYNPKTDDLTALTIDQNLSNQFIAGIVEDLNQTIWVTTAGGVASIGLMQDPNTMGYTFHFKVYNEKDGLQNSEFNQRSIKRLASGAIIMGGLYGVNYFFPDDLKFNKVLPNVLFTKFMVFNDEVEIGTKYGDVVILRQALNQVEEVRLNHKQHIFTVQLGSDSHILPDKIKYVYKMEGLNDDWVAAVGNKITYAGLSPGTYLLKVRSINSDGLSSDQESILKIVINPPFWLSIWAYICYAMLIIALLIWARLYILRIERRKFSIVQKKQKEAKEQEVNDMKLRFFANISNDLRTPLTSIISPLEGIIDNYEKDNLLVDKLKMVKHNAVKMLNLINELLDFRKSDVSVQQVNLTESDIVAYTNNICTSFTEFSEGKDVRFSFYSPLPILNMSFDEDKIGKIIMNLVSNAFKFNSDGGRVEVTLDIVQEYGLPEMVEIRVADTGIGISDEDKEHIFDRFYQIETPNIATSGSGLGLSIVRDFVILHGGTVKVVDNTAIGVGSVFIVRIPIRHSGGQPVVEQEKELDTSFIQTVADFKKSKDGEDEKEESIVVNPYVLEEDDIETVSSIKVQRAKVIQLTEEEDGTFMAQVMLPDILPEDSFENKGRRSVEELSVVPEVLDKAKESEEDKRPLVLVVDDNEGFRNFMYASLSSTYRVKLATDGPEAWKMIPELMPNMVLSEMMIADAESHQLCSLVKTDHRTAHILFVILTGRQSSEAKAEGKAMGADDFITKPFNMNILTLRMQKLLNARRKGRSRFEQEAGEVVITPMDEKLIDHAVKYVESNISRSDLSVEELSRGLGMSRVNLYKKLVLITGQTPIEFIRLIRLKRASQLLRQGQQNVSEVAFQVGFNNPKYFTKYFKDEFGMLPSSYQDREAK